MKPSSIFRKALLASVISSTFALTGCGGSDEENTTTTPPPADSGNKAPTVSITGEAQAKEQAEFKLTANAADSDGSIATFAWTHNSNLDLIVEGADTAEFTVKSPDISEDTAVTFTLTVTDDGGATASIDKAVVIKRRVSSVTITGLVTDKPIQNANLTIFAGNSSVNAVADETGRYTATFTVDESEAEALVQIKATGLGDQDNVEFVSQLNSMDKLVEQAGEDGELISDENFGVNITNVTTAEYALLTRDGEAYSTDEELQQALLNIDAEQKLKLAALIKIVVDNDDYDLPEGVTSTLDLVDDAATAAQFEQEVNEREPGLIEQTEEEIKDDDDLVTSSTTLGAGDFIIHSPEFVTNSAYHLSLGADGKGGSVSAVNQVEIDTWSINEGKLEAVLKSPLVISQSMVPKRDENGRTVTDDQGKPILEEVKYKTSKLTVQVLAENDVYRTIDYTTHAQRYVLEGAVEVLDESYDGGEKPHTANLLDKSKTLEIEQDDLLGTWYLNVKENNNLGDITSVEKLTFLAGGQVETAKTDETITWRVENNLLTLIYTYTENGEQATGSMTMWITKSLEAGYQFVAMDNGTATDAHDAHAKSEWGWLFKQDTDLVITKDDIIGRWHGFIGFNQDRFDMVVEADLNVKIGLNESSRDGRFENGIFYRERYREDGNTVRFCDVANSNCQLVDQMKHEFVAVEDDKYFIRRIFKGFDHEGNEQVISDNLFIYEYTSDLKYSEFSAGLLASGSTFYTYNAEGKLVEGSFDYYTDYNADSLVTELKVGEQTYVFSLVDGKLEYNTPDGRFVVELIEHTETGLKVCTYPQGESCSDENMVVWSFQMPHVGEFFINNPEYFNSSTYKVKLEQSRWSKEALVKLPDSRGDNTFSWHLENGAIVLPIARQESSFMTHIDGQQVYQEIYLNYIKLKIANDGSVEVEESRTVYHDGSEVRTEINQYDAQKFTTSDFLSVEESDLIGTWAIDGATVINNIGKGLYTFNDSGVGSVDLGFINGEQQSREFNWEVVDGTLKVMHTDGINVEQFHITKDLRVDGYQAVAERSEYESSWVSSSLMVKQQGGINYTAADYVGRWLYKNGQDAAEAWFAMEIYDGLEVRFGTSLSSIQGRSVQDGQFIRSRYVNPLENSNIVAPCEVQTETCQLRHQMIYTPLATENNRTYFRRVLNSWWNGEVNWSESNILVQDKAETIEIPRLEKYMNFGMQDSSDQSWSSREIGTDGDVTTYSLTIGDAEPLPYTLEDGKITIRMADGLVYNLELIPGSNTKEGITLCKYLTSESCEAGEEVRLSYPVLY